MTDFYMYCSEIDEEEFEAIALMIREIEKKFSMESIKQTVARMEAM